jgi:hypothetical protein
LQQSNLNEAPGAVDLFVNCIFMLDILLNFRTAYPSTNCGSFENF